MVIWGPLHKVGVLTLWTWRNSGLSGLRLPNETLRDLAKSAPSQDTSVSWLWLPTLIHGYAGDQKFVRGTWQKIKARAAYKRTENNIYSVVNVSISVRNKYSENILNWINNYYRCVTKSARAIDNFGRKRIVSSAHNESVML